MAGKLSQPDFFNRKVADMAPKKEQEAVPRESAEKQVVMVRTAEKKAPEKITAPTERPDVVLRPADSSVKLSERLHSQLNDVRTLLNRMGRKSLLPELDRIEKELNRRRFTVAVVGEFSKGKSTFINRFFGREFLPTGNLPTTALLTKIRYNRQEMLMLFDGKGHRRNALPLKLSSWDGMTADIDGNDPQGVALVGLNSEWLAKTGIEIEDTPGAGDLEGKRAQLIGEALSCDDGAIITISATAPLSMSEKVFIEQRLISPKTPYLMMIITKLDQVPISERSGIVDYIRSKLAMWNYNIPVFIPYDIEMPDDSCADIIGTDKVRAELERWLNDPDRAELTERWLSSRLSTVLDSALASIKEQELLLQADDEKRRDLISQKKLKLSDASVEWDKLRLKMENRCIACYEQLADMIDDHKIRITERLQYEASHASNPEQWWKQDYPYRLKVEIMNLSGNVDSFVNRRINEDIRWFNAQMNEQFKTRVLNPSSQNEKIIFDDFKTDENIEFENIGKKRNIVRVGTAALTAAGYFALSSLGAFPIIATLGVGTGSSIISEKVFKGKIAQQQALMKESIAKNVPEVIDNAAAQSEANLSRKYNEIIEAARNEEEAWLAAQQEAIENSVKDSTAEAYEKLNSFKTELETLKSRIK